MSWYLDVRVFVSKLICVKFLCIWIVEVFVSNWGIVLLNLDLAWYKLANV